MKDLNEALVRFSLQAKKFDKLKHFLKDVSLEINFTQSARISLVIEGPCISAR